MKDKHFIVKVPVSDMKDSFTKIINSPHRILIAKVITDNLHLTPKGLQQLYLAMNGIEENISFKVGDKCTISTSWLSGYRCDITRFVEGEDLYQGDLIVQIEEIDLLRVDCLKVMFVTYKDTSADEKTEIEMWLDPEIYKPKLFKEDFPIE